MGKIYKEKVTDKKKKKKKREEKKKEKMSDTFEQETEFFGFTPISFIDDVINFVNEYLYSAINSLKNYVEENCQMKDASNAKEQQQQQQQQEAIQHGIDQVVSLFESAIDINFDKFELYVLKNIFRIPPNTVLPHQQVCFFLLPCFFSFFFFLFLRLTYNV